MESASGWECKGLISELRQGMEQAMQLRAHLSSTESQDLLQRIMSSYEKAFLILRCSGPAAQSHPTIAPISTAPESSSLSVEGSAQSDDLSRSVAARNEYYSNMSKKRKALPTWTEQVRICSHTGLEGPGDDGFSWRKYGQKDILGAKYPRSYYRCTHRLMQNCWATKQVQRSDDDPSVFEITYKGTHTCNLATQSAPPPPSPETQEPKQSYHLNNNECPQPIQMLMNFRSNLRVNTDNLEIKEDGSSFPALPTFTSMIGENQLCSLPMLAGDSVLGTYTPPFISPVSSGSNYFTASPCQTSLFPGVQDLLHSESEPTGIFSANTSCTNSPIAGLEFSIDPVGLDPNFPFNAPGFSHDPGNIFLKR